MNAEICIYKGELALCDLDDFNDTIESYDSDDIHVVCLCRYHAKGWEGITYHHYLSFRKYTPKDDWVRAAKKVIALLEDGKSVLVHCIHGRDRTGTIGYVVLRHSGMNHEEACNLMYKMRPKMAKIWRTLLRDRRKFHEDLLKMMD